MKHTSCEGCRYSRKGLCADWTVRDVLGGVQRTDDGVRRCYESPTTLGESLVLYLMNHEQPVKA